MPYKMQPADVQAKFEEYRRQCDENIETVRYRDKLVQVPRKIIYTLAGFCLFAGIGEDDLDKYGKNKNYAALFKNIRHTVLCRKMHALVNGEGNTRGLIFDLKVNHGIDPKHVQEEDIDWKITLNLNHDNPGWEPPKWENEEDGELESAEDGELESAEDGELESPEDGKSEREEESKAESAGAGQEAIKGPSPELPPEVKTAAVAQPPVTPGVRPGLVPTGGVLPYGTPPKLNYEPEYKPERRDRYSRW